MNVFLPRVWSAIFVLNLVSRAKLRLPTMRQHFCWQIYVPSLQNLYEWSCGCHCKFPGTTCVHGSSRFSLSQLIYRKKSQSGAQLFPPSRIRRWKKAIVQSQGDGCESDAVMSCESCGVRHYWIFIRSRKKERWHQYHHGCDSKTE